MLVPDPSRVNKGDICADLPNVRLSLPVRRVFRIVVVMNVSAASSTFIATSNAINPEP